MRIGFDAKRAMHNFRGLGNYSRGLIEGLLNYHPENQLFLYSPKYKDIRAKKWSENLSAEAKLIFPQSVLGEVSPALWRSFFSWKDIAQDKLDIFHGLSHEIPFGLKKLNLKTVVTMHDLIFLRYPEFFPLIDRMVYFQKFSFACKNSDKIFAICEQTKLDLMELLGVNEKKIIVHYQSCDPIFYKKFSSEEIFQVKLKFSLEKPYILNVGAFEERKNQLMLVDAFFEVKNKIQEDLVFIGQGKKYKSEVINRVSELKLEKRIHFLENVSFQDLPILYQGSSAFCFPSLFEGFGIPIVEALFSNTPVITSFGSCFPESAGPDAYYIDPQSLSGLSNGLVQVLNDENLKKRMISNGFDYVQRFHRKNSTEKLIEHYYQITAN